MRIKLKDIIDLDYLLSVDEKIVSDKDIEKRIRDDREIFLKCSKSANDDRSILMSWLEQRREQFYKDSEHKGLKLLPGSIFALFYKWMLYLMIFLGFFTGISLVYSFLAYHGIQPINVTVFISLFIVLQFIVVVFPLFFLLKRYAGLKSFSYSSGNSMVQAFISSLFFNVLPALLKKINMSFFRKSLDTIEYTASLIRMKNLEYKEIFFWPFFIMSSVFALGFSIGSLSGTFFRVVTSDMAFGWQSTLLTGSSSVYKVVSFIAMPWSWFVPHTLAHPSIEQIEGTRMILKESISVLATKDLVSWWPFLCLGIIFYAVLPRFILIIAGAFAQKKSLLNFDFERPRFKKLIIKMQSPFWDIDFEENPVIRIVEPKNNLPDQLKINDKASPAKLKKHGRALLLTSKAVYDEQIIEDVKREIRTSMFINIEKVVYIDFDFSFDKKTLNALKIESNDHVIVLHEVWQPPIKGLLHYFKQIKEIVFKENIIFILLTQNPLEATLSVAEEDINFKVWKKAVLKLGNLDIAVQRFRE